MSYFSLLAISPFISMEQILMLMLTHSEENKELLIAFTNTVVDPRTVMIHFTNAPLTDTAHNTYHINNAWPLRQQNQLLGASQCWNYQSILLKKNAASNSLLDASTTSVRLGEPYINLLVLFMSVDAQCSWQFKYSFINVKANDGAYINAT